MEEKRRGRVSMDTTHWGRRFPRAHARCLSPADFQWKYPFSSNLNRPQKALRPSQASGQAGAAVNPHTEEVQWRRGGKKPWNQSESVQGKTQIGHAHFSWHAMTMSYGVFTKTQSHELWIYACMQTHLTFLAIIFCYVRCELPGVHGSTQQCASPVPGKGRNERWMRDSWLPTGEREQNSSKRGNQSTCAYSRLRIKGSIFPTTFADKTDGLTGRHKEDKLKLPNIYLHQMVYWQLLGATEERTPSLHCPFGRLNPYTGPFWASPVLPKAAQSQQTVHRCILILHYNRSVLLFRNCNSSFGDFFLPLIVACTVAGPCHPAMTLPQALLSIPCWQSAVAEQGTKAAANKCCIQHSSPISPPCCPLQWLLHPATHTLCLLGRFCAKPQREERGLGSAPSAFLRIKPNWKQLHTKHNYRFSVPWEIHTQWQLVTLSPESSFLSHRHAARRKKMGEIQKWIWGTTSE